MALTGNRPGIRDFFRIFIWEAETAPWRRKDSFIIIRHEQAAVNGGAEHTAACSPNGSPLYTTQRRGADAPPPRIFGDPETDFTEGESVERRDAVLPSLPPPDRRGAAPPARETVPHGPRVRRHLDQLHLLGVSSLHPVWRIGTGRPGAFSSRSPTTPPRCCASSSSTRSEYAALLFMNFYFSQTVLGSVIAPQKTILIPLVHPDKNLYWALNAPMFTRVRHRLQHRSRTARRPPDLRHVAGPEQSCRLRHRADDGRRLGSGPGPLPSSGALCPLSGARYTLETQRPHPLFPRLPPPLRQRHETGAHGEASTRRRAKRPTRRSSARGLSATPRRRRSSATQRSW